MLEKLVDLFESSGNNKKKVRITHTNDAIPTSEGICSTINKLPGFENHFTMILDTGEHFMFVPENVGSDFVEGPYVHARNDHSRRKIQVVADDEIGVVRPDEDDAMSSPVQNFNDDDIVVTRPDAEVEPFRGGGGTSGGAGTDGSWPAPEAESQPESPSESPS